MNGDFLAEVLSACVIPGMTFVVLYIMVSFNWRDCYCSSVPDFIGAAPTPQSMPFVSASSVPPHLSAMSLTGVDAVDGLAWVAHSIRLTVLYYWWGAECRVFQAVLPHMCKY